VANSFKFTESLASFYLRGILDEKNGAISPRFLLERAIAAILLARGSHFN
jgi:hypothetical protein